MKLVFSFLVFFYCLVSAADQETFKLGLFETDVHPFLTKNCAQCHSETSTDPIGPAHAHSSFETAFLEFDKRMRVGEDVEKSSMWRVGTNGHFCKDHDVNCDDLDQITNDLKEALKAYSSIVIDAFPQQSESVQVQREGEHIFANFEIAKDIKGSPVLIKIKMLRLPESDFVILEDLRMLAQSGAFFLDGLDIYVNGAKLSKVTGFENIKRHVYFSNPEDLTAYDYDGEGRILAPFKPMFKFADDDNIEIKVRSIKQLRRANSLLCDFMEKSVNEDITSSEGLSLGRYINLVAPRLNRKEFGMIHPLLFTDSRGECTQTFEMIDFENANNSPILFDFYGVTDTQLLSASVLEERVALKMYIIEIVNMVNEMTELEEFITPIEENVYAELTDDNVGDLFFSDNPVEQRGFHLYNTAGCVNCHGKNLSGGLQLITPGGNFNVPNISAQIETGIGAWSIENFKSAMRDGLSPDGTRYFAAFPYTTYRNMTDDDIEALYAYIKGASPVYKEVEEHDPSFLASLPFAKRIWRAQDNQPDFIEDIINGEDGISKGAYNAIAVTHCGECHYASIRHYTPP